jgi:3-phosphoshikimate 1-carboxyvinyltransferase
MNILSSASTTAYIAPGPQQLHGTIWAQPSKNYTTRFLLAAALATGQSIVHNVATSEDATALQRCLDALGAHIELTGRFHPESAEGVPPEIDAVVKGTGGQLRLKNDEPLNAGNAGAVLRFLLAVCATLPRVTFVTDRPDSLGKRPNDDLLAALEQLGCRTESQSGCLPITLWGGNLRGGRVEINGSRSSQFVSGLLFLAPLVKEPLEIIVTERLVSKAPVRQTLEVLERCGVHVEAAPDLMRFRIEPQPYRAGEYRVNGDWPGSAAILAAAAVTGSNITVRGLRDDNQGEKAAARVLEQMGAMIQREGDDTVSISSTGTLQAVAFDGDLATDAVLALVGAACFARGRSRFYNVANLRIKECDRISEPLAELRRIGVRCWEGKELGDPDPDAIIIEGNPDGYEGGVEVDGRGDHRVIMLQTIVGLGCRRGLRIRGAQHVAKSYPLFFEHLRQLDADILLRSEAE